MSNRDSYLNARHSIDDDTNELPMLTDERASLDPDDDTDPLVPGLRPEVEVSADPASADGDAVDLDQDPFDDNVIDELEQRAPRRKSTRLAIGLAAGVIVVAGFLGGSLAQKHWGTSNTTNPFANLGNGLAGAPGGLSASGGTGRGGASATPITGTVKLVDGTTVYVVESDGTVLVVKTGSGTTISSASSVGSLTVGSTVTVTGQTGSDGSVDATSITKTK